jgi:hypothetical protein
MKRENFIVAIFGAVFLFALIMILGTGFRSTGYVTESSTVSNVTITTYFAIGLSLNLTQGIQFGEVATLPATNVNASHNNDSINTTGDTAGYNYGAGYWINVSTDSNSVLDFCIKADALNTSTGDEIGLGNETYSNHTVTNSTFPLIGSETGLATGYVKSGDNIGIGSSNYYRFWLDVPAGTATGVYNNTVSFKGVTSTASC